MIANRVDSGSTVAAMHVEEREVPKQVQTGKVQSWGQGTASAFQCFWSFGGGVSPVGSLVLGVSLL